MKKSLFTIMLAFLVVFGVNAQEFGKANNKETNALNVQISKSMKQMTSSKGVIFSDDFEADNGWTLDADWTRGVPTVEPNAAYSGSNILGGPLDADYVSSQAVMYATSPVIDCSAQTAVTLSFQSFSGCESSSYDNISIEVYDGSAWVQIWSNSEWGGSNQETAWTYYEFNVTTQAAGNANFQVRYVLGASDSSVQYSGWAIDDFTVTFPEPHDLGVVAVVPTFVESGQTVTPQVTVQNFGSLEETSYNVTLTDGDAYTSSIDVTTAIAAGTTLVVDMDDWTPADGTYSLTAIVTVANDANTGNDMMSIDGTVAVVNAYAGNTSTGTYGSYDLTTGTYMPFGTIGTDPFPMAQEFNGVEMYRVYNDESFGTVAGDGTYTNLGTLTGFTGTPTGLAWNWNTNTMYVVLLDGNSLPNLCTLNIETLELTPIGGASVGMLIGMDFANDGFLYAPSLDDDMLYQIDPATGVTTSIGALGIDINYGQDVSFNADDNMLYTISCGAVYAFGTYDLATGAFTNIADAGSEQYGTFAITTVPEVTGLNITFNVDMTAPIADGDFVVGTDSLFIAGFPAWDEPGTNPALKMADEDADGIYTIAFTDIAPGTVYYKYFKNAGWDGGEWTGDPNRTFVFEADTTLNDTWGVYDGVSVENINNNISVYPNPSNGLFNLNVNGTYNLDVIDITGKVIETRVINNNTTVQINNAGMYFLKLTNGTNVSVERVIVK